jgi:uncharacterized membrane protein
LCRREIPLSEKTRTEKIYSAFFEQEFPADLTLMVLWLAVAIGVIFLPILNDSILRIILSLPMVLFIPGYCLIAALFPKKGDIDIPERIMLSIGLSIAVGPLIGLGLNFTMWGIRLEPIVLSLTLFSWIMVLVAKYRRAILPPEEQFSLQVNKILPGIQNVFLPRRRKRIDRLLNIVLPAVAIVAIITTAFVIAFPKQGERFSEFYILGENQRASEYPDQLLAGMTYPLYIGVGNQESRTVTYTIETWAELMEFDTVTNTSHLVTMDLIDRLPLVLAHNETQIIPYNLSVKKPGYNRVEFLLFNETIPDLAVTGNDRINASYRQVHLWVTVR